MFDLLNIIPYIRKYKTSECNVFEWRLTTIRPGNGKTS